MPKGKKQTSLMQAYFDAWIDRTSLFDGTTVEKAIDDFAFRWGGVSKDALNRALQQGDTGERLLALFALGYLPLLNGEPLLIPFWESPVRKERWASAISLGQCKNERVFSVLQELLMEELEYCLPSLTASSGPGDPLLKKAWEKEQDDKDAEYVWEYDWCLLHRLKIPLLLGSWGNPHAIPVLVQAFQRSLELEFRSTYPNNFHIFAQEWHQLQDRVAYALGQLGAWNALDGLDLPPKRMHIAHRYLVFGSFHASVPWVFSFLFLANWGKDGRDISANLARSGADLTLGLPDPEHVNQVFQERFSFLQENPLPSFHAFLQWHDERNDEWQDRWDAEQTRTNQT